MKTLKWFIVGFLAVASAHANLQGEQVGKTILEANSLKGLVGKISEVRVAVPAAQIVTSIKTASQPNDIDLKHMAQWAMNYLINTPRQAFNYEPVFQCHPLRCPPIPTDTGKPRVLPPIGL